MKPWETIRLLLACQDSRERLYQISGKRSDNNRRLKDLRISSEKMCAKIQRLDSEFALICKDEKVKYSEIEDLEKRKRKLYADLAEAGSNTQYREINNEIERCKRKKEELETATLEILEYKEAKIHERDEAKKLQYNLSQQHDKEEQEIRNALKVLDADEHHEKEHLQKLTREFPAEDQWFQHFSRLVNKGKRNAIVEVVLATCPGCNLEICTDLLQKARSLDHIVKCENCDRIMFSTSGATLLCVDDIDIEQGRLLLPLHLALRGMQSVRIRDVWGNWHEAKVNGDWLTGLKELFAAHALSPGEQVKLIMVGASEDVLRLEPEMVSKQELDRIVTRIESSDQPLTLDSVVAEMLEKKVRVYRLKLLSSKVRSDLEKVEGIFFRGNLVWHSPLYELPKPRAVPPPLFMPPKSARPLSPPPTETSITLDSEAIEAGVFPLCAAFLTHFTGVDSGEKITIGFGISEHFVVEYDATAQALKGEALRLWYQSNGLDAGEKVILTVRDGEQKIFHIHTEWKRDLNHLLEQVRKGTLSYSGGPRDLLFGLLAEANQALHYRDLWSRATEISILRIGTVVSTLSRYNQRLFCSVGGGRWGLVEWPSEKLQEERQRGSGTLLITPLSHPDEQALWKAIYEIEEDDLVYKLLKRTGSDLSYPNIARKLAEMLNVNVEHLIETSFLNVHDERLQRLANGSWTLKEFVIPHPPESKPVPPLQEAVAVLEEPRTRVAHVRWPWYFLAALIGGVAFVWFLARKK